MKHEPYEELAKAVVMQAVKDYRLAVKRNSSGRKSILTEKMKNDCERFFRSKHFSLYTSLDGKLLLQKLEQEVAG